MSLPSVASARPRPVRTRRRQRSTRLSVAVGLLALSAAVVVATVLTGSWALVTLAAGLAVVLGAAATRITHTELAESRREAARDRAVQARAHLDLTLARTSEHASYVDTVQARIREQETVVHGLEDALSAAQRRAAETTRKLGAEARRAEQAERAGHRTSRLLEQAEERAADAIVRVAELEQEVDVVRAELQAVTSTWRAAGATRRGA